MASSTEAGRQNPYDHLIREIPGHGKYYSLPDMKDDRIAELPYSIRILLEAAVRCCDEFEVKRSDVENLLNWKETSQTSTEIRFKPSRVLLQDFTGVPVAVDFAAMRDAMVRLGGNPDHINPLVPADLVIDHSVQVDYSRGPDALKKNQDTEFERNAERFAFLKWAASAFSNMLILPPGAGIVHQVNLEYFARVVFNTNGMLYPDTLVGTDSHTTMVDGLGVTGWGVGGIEAEAVMLGQPISMVVPEVVGFKLTGSLREGSTATDLVLTVTRMLRERGVVGKFVEFFGEGCKSLTPADRATVSNMSPEYGATMGYFPVDDQSLAYLKQTGRSPEVLDRIEKYMKAQGLYRMYDASDAKIQYSGDVLRLNLSDLAPCVSGPKRPHDQVVLTKMQSDFRNTLTARVGFKGYGLSPEKAGLKVSFEYKGKTYDFRHGSIVIASITSCTNTSNPSVMLGAGLVAKAAVEAGLTVMPYIKTSLSPGSRVVLAYLRTAGLLPYLEQLGFYLAGFGCQTCIGNSGGLDPEVANVITGNDFIAAAVLSGNRNFEGRIHPLTRANYLMSPMLVVAYALAGTTDIDLQTTPLGKGKNGQDVYLRDIWPEKHIIDDVESRCVLPAMYTDVYSKIQAGGSRKWQELSVSKFKLFPWSDKSTYIHDPPFFKTMKAEPEPVGDVKEARCLLYVGDSVTTDHISPAGSIAKGSPAGTYLESLGVTQPNYNSYGSRRGNDEVMARGTFANIRLINKLASKPGPHTRHFPSRDEMSVYDAAQRYKKEGRPLIILAGKEYGSGSSRDWAAKGPHLLGVHAVIAESYERIHRSNLVGMGILPLQFMNGQGAEQLQIQGDERFSVLLSEDLTKPRQTITVMIHRANGKEDRIETQSRIDTEVELEYFRHGGILQYVLRRLLK